MWKRITMAVKIDTDDIVKSASEFRFNLGYCYLVGVAEIGAKRAFLALSEIETYKSTNPFQRVVECMSSEEKAKFQEIISSAQNKEDENRALDDSIAYIKKWALMNKLPPLDKITYGLAYCFANGDAKNLRLAVGELIKKAKENGTLKISVDNEQELFFPKEQAEAFNADLQNANTIEDIIDSLHRVTKGNVSKIYNGLAESLMDFFLS